MPIADTKKCATLINVAAEEVEKLKTAATRLERCRQLFQDQSVDPTGTALDGNVAQVSAWIDSVRAVADDVVANGLLAHVVPSHRNAALGEVT